MLNRRLFVIALLLPTSLFIFATGVYPAFTRVQTDFPNYYTSGSIVRTGNNVDRLYDDAWFNEQIQLHGMTQGGKFSPFPPPTALLFVSLSYFDPLDALRILTLINLVLLALTVRILSTMFSPSTADSILFVMLSGWGLANCLRFGQLYIALSLTMFLAFVFVEQKKPILAGLASGILIPVKYFSAIMILYFLLKKEWKAALAALTTTIVIFVASIGIMGWEIHQQWLTVLSQHLQSHLSQQNPFSSTFQSFDSLFRRLFVYDEHLNHAPLLDHPLLFDVFKSISISSVILVSVLASVRLRKTPEGNQLILVILCLAGLLIAPATATYHYLLLWLPIAILLRHFHSGANMKHFWITLGLYVCIGFLPLGHLSMFDGRGALTLIAYPRLAAMLALFWIAVFGTQKVNSKSLFGVT